MKKQQSKEREKALYDLIWEHKGRDNAIGTAEIAEYLTKLGYPMSATAARHLVVELARKWHLPICHLNSKGFYFATCKDDLRDSICDLQSRIAAMQERIKILESYILE